jgi:hypothetical protein
LPDSLSISVSREGTLVRSHGALHRVSWAIDTFTLKKLECSKQALLHGVRPNNVAWNNGIGPRFYFVGLKDLR